MSQNILALIITFISAIAWLRINDYAAHRGWISSQLSRKIIHMGTGPIFVLCWLLYDDAYYARFLAALVPLMITIQFILVGVGVVRDDSAVQAMSRSGDRREILRGPLFYGIVFILLTVIYWLDSPIGIVALMLMCGGDGLADIVGRRFGRGKLPWNPEKTWAGSAGMFTGGWLFAVMIIGAYVAFGVFVNSWTAYFPAILLIAIAGTVVESLPIHDVDNLTVTITSVVLGNYLF